MDYFILSNPVSYSSYINFQERIRKKRKECILVLEHIPTITAGVNFKRENLLVSQELLLQKGIEFYFIKRGGDLTAHERGQIVIYPHIDLKKRNIKLTQFLSILQTIILNTVELVWDLELVYFENKPGFYLKKEPSKKLISLGFNFQSFFTSYGLALNFENDLSTFQYIHPCGEEAENITSIQNLGLDTSLKMDFILEVLDAFHEYFK